jgi:hypothetical protein
MAGFPCAIAKVVVMYKNQNNSVMLLALKKAFGAIIYCSIGN